MKAFTFVPSALAVFASGAAAADESHLEAVAHVTDGTTFSIYLNSTNYFHVSRGREQDHIKVKYVDLLPNADAFKRCSFNSRDSASIKYEHPAGQPERYTFTPAASIGQVSCEGCVPKGKQCFFPSSDAQLICCEGSCIGSICR
ncbi:hypothetical protein PWT90_07410 [Aphanocladium album]|nr:hypothetical protein PWT90_07410 [Aphanocladium album]